MAEHQFITRYRFFLVHMYKEEEEWLESMSHRGWHLVDVMFGIRFTFVKGDPIDYKYSLDYRKNCEFDSDYIQLFKDAGWDYIGKFLRWRYFRSFNDSNACEMFNDNTDLIERNNHLISLLSIIMGLNLAIFLINLLISFTGEGMNFRTSMLNLGVVLILRHVINKLKIMNKDMG